MMKDFTLGLETVKPEGIETDGVKHRRTLYFDLLEGTDLPELHKAKERLLEHYRENYYHPPALTTQDNEDLGASQKFKKVVEEGKGEGIFKVGVFLSASSENLQLNQDTKDFGRWLAGNGYGIVYGGGDRYLMGSLHEGYNEGKTPEEHSNHKTFEAGFSTPEIVKSETKHGVLPKDMDVAILNEDIYQRMAQMIALTDDAIIIRPGGAGTVQELAAVLLMKEVYGMKDDKGEYIIPEIGNKKIIIQNPPLIDKQDPFYDPVLERLFGDKYQILKEESKPGVARNLSDKLGIYIAHDDEQIKSLLEDIKGEWQHRTLSSGSNLETASRIARL
jgi:predicted Rossmann-fold nucleotide-binding protein